MSRSIPVLLALGLLGACNPPVNDTTDTSTHDTSTTDTSSNAVTVEDCSQITPDQSVSLHNISYNPSTLTISVGQTVEWTNNDSFNHTVTSGTPNNPDGTFDSGTLAGGDTYCLQFNTAGTYDYYCRIHLESMTGSVTVQ